MDVLKTLKSTCPSYLNYSVSVNTENTGASNNWPAMLIKYQACSYV